MDTVEINQDDEMSESKKKYLEVQSKREEKLSQGCVLNDDLWYAPCEDGSYKLIHQDWNDYGPMKQLECYDIPREINGKPVSAIADGFVMLEKFKKIIIPDSVIDICDSSLKALTWYKKLIVEIDSNNPVYKVVDGNICSKDGRLLTAIGKSDSETEIFYVPDEINAIERDAIPFEFILQKQLYSVIIIPLSVKHIHYAAFGAVICCGGVGGNGKVYHDHDARTKKIQKEFMSNKTICYMGTKKDWKNNMSKVTKSLYKNIVCFYSEKPVKNSWHYADDGVTPVITKK